MLNKYIKKIVSLMLIVALTIQTFYMPLLAYASSETRIAYVTNDGDGVRIRANTNTSSAVLGTLTSYTRLTVYDIIPATDGVCQTEWYYIAYDANLNKGYVCAKANNQEYVKLQPVSSPTSDYNFDEELLKFPESYRSYLIKLHEENPNWMFKALDTGLDWNQTVSIQSIVGTSFIQGSEQGYRSTDGGSYNYETDTFYVQEGSDWYAANSKTVAYYMDPRNFLDKEYVFMFEKLNYDPSYQTLEAVESILYTDFMKQYTSHVMTAANLYDINPIYLAARIRQEVGLNPGTATSGAEFTYKGTKYPSLVGTKFSGLYNFYNIGATTDTNPVYNGLILANGGITLKTTYNRPWNTPEKAIIGGAWYIAEDYINIGQYTPYLQKWNVNPNSAWPANTHQYMTNIKAPSSEAYSVYRSYIDMGLIGQNFVFEIPVYKNMPTSTTLPNKGNPNNYLTSISVGGTNINNFSNNTLSYDVYLPKYSKTTTIDVRTINSNALVTGAGVVNLTNKVTPVTLKITAQNGDIRNYTVNIHRPDEDLATLNYLSVSNHSLNIPFTFNTFNYSVGDISLGTDKLTINATTTYPNDNIKYFVNGVEQINNVVNLPNTLGNGNIKVKVTSADLSSSKEYTITYNKIASNNAYLNSLKSSVGSLSPTFTKDIYNYSLTVDNSVTNLTITAVTDNIKSAIVVNGTDKFENHTFVLDNLPIGNTPLSIVVRAEDGSKKTYTINITRLQEQQTMISYIVNNIGVKNNENYISGIKTETNVSTLDANIKKVNPLASVIIKDSNGVLKTNDKFKTGDTVTIVSGQDAKTFTVIIYGDTNGDGAITIADLLRVQKTILGSISLSEYYKIAADVNKDGVVNIVDLLRVQKNLLGQATIEQ